MPLVPARIAKTRTMSRAGDSHRMYRRHLLPVGLRQTIMQTYLVRRVGIAADARELDAALTRLRSFEEQPSALPARWLHSFALREADGRFGLACVFEADGVQTLHRHADSIRLPASEVLRVTSTRVVRPFAPTMVYLIRRRNFWITPAELDRSNTASRRIADEEMARELSWLRSYAVREDDGTLGTVCLYQSVDPQALRKHAERVGMPADEITTVIGRIVFRDDLDARRTASGAAPARAAIH
jgi:hypothetical protein